MFCAPSSSLLYFCSAGDQRRSLPHQSARFARSESSRLFTLALQGPVASQRGAGGAATLRRFTDLPAHHAAGRLPGRPQLHRLRLRQALRRVRVRRVRGSRGLGARGEVCGRGSVDYGLEFLKSRGIMKEQRSALCPLEFLDVGRWTTIRCGAAIRVFRRRGWCAVVGRWIADIRRRQRV